MEEGSGSEVSCEEVAKNAGESPRKKAKRTLLTSPAREDSDREGASYPPVEARGLTGGAFVLQGCRTVGNVMAKLAMARDIFADRVVALDPESGQVMDAADRAAPLTQFVIISEEDAVVDISATRLNLLLHAQQGDRVACSRLVSAMETLGRIQDSGTAGASDDWDSTGSDGPITAEAILFEVISRRDAEWITAVNTLIHVGVPAGHAFLSVARSGYADVVRCLLSAQPSLIGFEDESGNTALIEAAKECHHDIVAELLAAGANVERANTDGMTALMEASWNGCIKVVGELLTAGAKVNRTDSCGDTALTFAAYSGNHYMLLLGDHRHIATEKYDKEIVVKLLAAGAKVEHTNAYGCTALVIAAGFGRAGALGKLLAAGSKVDHVCPDGNTGLTFAAARGYKDVVVKLLSAGANVEHANSDGDTALIRAAGWKRNGSDVVGKLLAAGAEVNRANSYGNSALNVAVEEACEATVPKLLAAEANVNHANLRGDTALIQAVAWGNSGVVCKLLAAGADVNHANSDGNSALTVAAYRNNNDIVAKLLAAEANVNHANLRDDTALIHAVAWGNSGVVCKLLAAGADVNHAGNSALAIAANHANLRDDTALAVATTYGGHADIVAKLLAAGAKIEQRN